MKKYIMLIGCGLIITACHNEYINDEPIMTEEIENIITEMPKEFKKSQQPGYYDHQAIMYLTAVFGAVATENLAQQISYNIFYSMALGCLQAKKAFKLCLDNQQCVQQIYHLGKYTFGVLKRYRKRHYNASFVDQLTCLRHQTIFYLGLNDEKVIIFCHNPYHRLTIFGL